MLSGAQEEGEKQRHCGQRGPGPGTPLEAPALSELGSHFPMVSIDGQRVADQLSIKRSFRLLC